MRKFILSAALAASMLLCGCSRNEQSGQITVLRIAAAENNAELNSLAQEIADKIGAEARIILSDSGGALKMLSNGEADLAVGYYTEEDSPGVQYRLTFPFKTVGIYAVYRSDISVTAAADLEGMLLGASKLLSESTLYSLEKSAKDGTLYCDDSKTAAQMLSDGEIDGYICYEDEAEELCADENVRCVPCPDLAPARYRAAVMRSNTDIYGIINGAIEEYVTEAE